MKNCLGTGKIKKLVREVDGGYVVWLACCNQYFRLEEPAYFVFTNYEKYGDRGLVADLCGERYSVPKHESQRFVAEILDGIESAKQTAMLQFKRLPEEKGAMGATFAPFSVRYYSINGKTLCFFFETQLYEHFLHPLLQHLETNIPSQSQPTPALFEIFGHNGRIALRVNNEVAGVWGEDESHRLNGMAFLKILNAVYDKEDNDWMAAIHASAVTNGTKTIVFTASPGSGKSTMAALLQQKGFKLVSDDYVPIDKHTKRAFPFPLAISVKEGATELLSSLYPSLSGNKLQLSPANKQVRYLPASGEALPAPVKEIIFIKYDTTIDFKIEKLSGTQALKMLLEETWVSPLPENANLFLDWYPSVSFYSLAYSDNEKALQAITNLFGNG